MKIFIYKLIVSLFFLYVFFELTIGSRLDYYKNTLNSFKDQQKRNEIKEKFKDEIKKAIEKENYLTDEERYLISNFIKKIQSELSTVEDK